MSRRAFNQFDYEGQSDNAMVFSLGLARQDMEMDVETARGFHPSYPLLIPLCIAWL